MHLCGFRHVHWWLDLVNRHWQVFCISFSYNCICTARYLGRTPMLPTCTLEVGLSESALARPTTKQLSLCQTLCPLLQMAATKNQCAQCTMRNFSPPSCLKSRGKKSSDILSQVGQCVPALLERSSRSSSP